MPQAHTPSQRIHRPAALCAAKSQEFANIVLRRSEKKALNAINHALERVRFFVPSAARPQKPKERIQEPAEKIFILVRSPAWCRTTWEACRVGQLHAPESARASVPAV